MRRSEMKLAEQAFRNRWPMDDDRRKTIIDQAMTIIQTSDKERNRIAAMRLLIAAESQNQQDEHKLFDRQVDARIAELDQVAIELGIDSATLEGIATETDGDTGPVKE